MRYILFRLLGVSLLLLVASSLYAAPALPAIQGMAAIPDVDDRMQMQQTVVVPKTTNLDDYLIALARNANVNFLCDTTELPINAPVTQFPETMVAMFTGDLGVAGPKVRIPSFYNVFLELTQGSKLSALRFRPDTFLFWKEPEIDLDRVELDQILAGEGVQIPNKPENRTQELALRAETGVMLSNYLRAIHNWKGRVLDPALKVKFAELPVDLRNNLTALTLVQMVDPVSRGSAWFSDDLWREARLKLSNPVGRAGAGQQSQVVSVSAIVNNRRLGIGLNW